MVIGTSGREGDTSLATDFIDVVRVFDVFPVFDIQPIVMHRHAMATIITSIFIFILFTTFKIVRPRQRANHAENEDRLPRRDIGEQFSRQPGYGSKHFTSSTIVFDKEE